MKNSSNNIVIIDNISTKTLQELLPKSRYSWIMLLGSSLKDFYCFGIKGEDGSLIAFCIYTVQAASSEIVTLVYIQVIEEYRNQGLASELIKGSLSQLKNWGHKTVIASALEEEDHKIIEKQGFPLYKSEFYLIYNSDILLSSKIGQNIEKLSPLRKHVKKISDLSPNAIKAFNKLLRSHGYHCDITKCDPHLTRYFVDSNGNVIAYLPVRNASDGISYMNTDLFILNDPSAKMALPAMIVDLLFVGKDKINSEASLVIYIDSQANVDAMMQGFGTPTITRKTDLYLYNIK